MDRRSVQYNPNNLWVSAKSQPIYYATDSARECALAARGKDPFSYVPPPESLLLATVPFKWPSDEDWSRTFDYTAWRCDQGR